MNEQRLNVLYWILLACAAVVLIVKMVHRKMIQREIELRDQLHDFYLKMREDYIAQMEKDKNEKGNE